MIIYCGDYTYLQPFYSLSELYAKILNNNALKICDEKKKNTKTIGWFYSKATHFKLWCVDQ